MTISTAFLGRLKTALDERDLTLKGITTDGSALYPEPIRTVFGEVPHQLCTFHVIKELTKGVLKAVATERERLAKSKPKLKRGRPSSKDKAARRLARKSKAMQQKISDLFQDRFLFVKRRLTPSERKRLLPSPVACLICANCARSWSTSMRCLTGAAARRPRWAS